MSRAAGLYRLSTGARLSDPHRDQVIGGAWRLWCVQVIGTLRRLGLTISEVRRLAAVYSEKPEETIGPHLDRP